MRLFHYATSRGSHVPRQYLDGFQGTLISDGYQSYEVACRNTPIVHLGCWAHSRRKFFEAAQLHGKGKTGKAHEMLDLIRQLYVVEKQMKDLPRDERTRIRQTQSKEIIDKIRKWLDLNQMRVAPKMPLGKAIQYMNRQWHKLIRYLEDGDYPIDNNKAENAIRPFVIGRKNWLFSCSQAGAKASANLYSLIETAKANGLDPYAYLKHVFKELPKAQSVADIESLLPWHCKSIL